MMKVLIILALLATSSMLSWIAGILTAVIALRQSTDILGSPASEENYD